MNKAGMLWITGMAAVVVGMVGWTAGYAWGEQTLETLLPPNERMEIAVNKSHLIQLERAAERVSVVNPEIADVQIIDPNQILVNAKSVGETGMIIWTEGGEHRAIDLVVKWNIAPIQAAMLMMLPDEAIEVVPMADGVALKGQIQDIESMDKAVEIATSFAPKVINLLNVPGQQQVMLKVKVAEVAKNFREELGFDFLVTNQDGFGGSILNNLIPSKRAYGTGFPDVKELTDAVSLFFGLPNDDVYGFIQAMKTKGLMHMLAEPNLISRSGETATFLAGGEYPIPVVQGGGLSNSVTVEYKEYGVRLSFTPTIVSVGMIHLDISPEVSDLDFANGVNFGGYTIPALVTRRVHTVVKLRDGQTFALAGLMSRSRQDTNRKVPFLGDIPMFGNLFRGSQKSAKDTELLIMVTPQIVAPLDSDAMDLFPKDLRTIESMYEVKPQSSPAGQNANPPANALEYRQQMSTGGAGQAVQETSTEELTEQTIKMEKKNKFTGKNIFYR